MQTASPHDKVWNRLPLIGRTAELSLLTRALREARDGAGKTIFLTGEGGIGKTRLAAAVAQAAADEGWHVALGRAYAVETGIPYALFSDALLPLLKKLEPSTLAVLTRGANAELAYLFPALAGEKDRERVSASADPSDLKARLLWNFSQFLGRYATKQPLLIVLENLQWADASSLELFHFVARQMPTQRIVLIATYNDAESEPNQVLRTTEQSLTRLDVATRIRLDPLSQAEVAEILNEVFGVDAASVRQFSALLYGWTRGNPFFVEETLKSLVESGALRRTGSDPQWHKAPKRADARWEGWEVESLQLPATVREVLEGRLDRLSENAREVANLTAVIGTSVTFDRLRAVTSMSEDSLIPILDELCGQRILEERLDTADQVAYDFTHPMLQQVAYSALGNARARRLHNTVGEALETFYGPRASAHAGELALHFSRGHSRASKAVRYLSAAGRAALNSYANREAAAFLSDALALMESMKADVPERDEVIRNLARARQRLGDYKGALDLWSIAREQAENAGDLSELASIEHRMGLACYWSGRNEDSVEHYAAGLAAAKSAADNAVRVRLHLAKGISHQDAGELELVKSELDAALAAAEESGDSVLLGRAHRALLLLHAWTGPEEVARKHGERALALAKSSNAPMLEWTAQWGMGLLAGLTSDATAVGKHLAECERLEEKLGSPLLPLWTAEISIQYASTRGDWDTGISIGERTIALAQALGQRTLLPRLLVWTGMIYLWRGELDKAKSYFDHAWELSDAERISKTHVDIPTVVPAHIGLASYHLETGNYEEAIRIGEAGLEIADRSGYVAWSLQWLLPVIGEAALWIRDVPRASKHVERMRRDATRHNHKVGIALADAADGLMLFYRDADYRGSIELFQSAIDSLETIPYPDTVARIRRALGVAMKDSGDREGAISELKKAHDTFARLGAAGSLAKIREELRKMNVRPPSRSISEGAAGLTGREIEIARMVAQRKSNKDIGTVLDISARTVSTHLSNIFTKLSVESRGELADYVRENGLLDGNSA
ncbi:MAG TPA: AAA family ATPase [Gemmatimonadaceae bacterium]|nr:AAA family ATPase [Gemmatimonadaceae bacterium]